MTGEIPGYRSSDTSPILYDEVNTHGDLGYFPQLVTPHSRHGFQWKNPENVSYVREADYPSDAALQRIQGRVSRFLGALGMRPITDAVVANTTAGDLNIVDITEELLASLPVTEERGKFVEAGAYFTTVPDVPIYGLSGDCTWTFVLGETNHGLPLMGLIHAGRFEADKHFTKEAIDHAVRTYGCDPASLKLGIIPSLEPSNHIIQEDDLPLLIHDIPSWGAAIYQSPVDNTYRVDVRTHVAEQYMKSGVRPENISLYLAGTFSSREQNEGFSHRYATVFHEPTKRFGVAAQLVQT